jgi:Na+-translocating ferredoxin:NAD+ oxidoreductase RnfD subunit
MKVFAYSKTDAVPVACALLHTAYLIGWFLIFPYAPWWLIALMGLVFSVSISWNINGIAHNFIHNPYFASPALLPAVLRPRPPPPPPGQ